MSRHIDSARGEKKLIIPNHALVRDIVFWSIEEEKKIEVACEHNKKPVRLSNHANLGNMTS